MTVVKDIDDGERAKSTGNDPFFHPDRLETDGARLRRLAFLDDLAGSNDKENDKANKNEYLKKLVRPRLMTKVSNEMARKREGMTDHVLLHFVVYLGDDDL